MDADSDLLDATELDRRLERPVPRHTGAHPGGVAPHQRRRRVRRVHHRRTEGGWYLSLRVSPRLMPQAASGFDAFAVLLHYGGDARDSGIALLPGELFGYGARAQGLPAGACRDRPDELVLRGTLAAEKLDLDRFIARLTDATTALLGPTGPKIVQAALKRARQIADVDEILATRRC